MTKRRIGSLTWLLPLVALGLFTLAGCDNGAEQEEGEVAAGEHEGHDHDDGEEHGHVHGAWWCAPHGVPEEDCTQCSTTAAEEAKANGDWCEEHNRAESQCFICHPEKVEEFAALYRAKYGEDPPALPEG